jgi:hypothetical protein
VSLKDNLADIIRIDNLIRELVRSRSVITLSEINKFRQLKEERKQHVRAIQSGGK